MASNSSLLYVKSSLKHRQTFYIIIFLFIFGNSAQLIAQNDVGKIFFPNHEKLQWYVNILGQPHTKKIARTFKKKFRPKTKNHYEFSEDSYYRSHTKEGLIYNLYISDDEPYVYMCNILSDMNKFGIPFMDSPTLATFEKRCENNSDYTIASIYKENKGGNIKVLYHPSKLLIELRYSGSKGFIVSAEFSKNGYKKETDKIIRAELTSKSKNMYNERGFSVDPKTIAFVDRTTSTYYQIGNILYFGELKDGVPHGEGRWGIFTSEKCPYNFSGEKEFSIIAKGKFENGKPVGEHNFKRNGKKMIYVYNSDGIATTLKKYNSDQYISFATDGSSQKASANALKYSIGKYTNAKYYGGINSDGQPDDKNGRLVLDRNTEVITDFVNGYPKNGAEATFKYKQSFKNVATVETTINSSLVMNGETKVHIQDIAEGVLHLKNGKADPYKNGELQFKKIRFTNDLTGAATFTGKISIVDILNSLFKGKNLEFSFDVFPDAKFKGDIEVYRQSIVPVGWHTVTEYENGVAKGTLKGKYTASGQFLDGQNLYQTKKAIIYKTGTFTDPRDGKTYTTVTYIRSESIDKGNLITWFLEDLDYRGITDEIWRFNRHGKTVNKAYYSYNAAKRACPSGWRLPNNKDINEFKILNLSQKAMLTLMEKIGLDKNGYVWERFGKTDMFHGGEMATMWLQDGKYISVNRFNKVQTFKEEKLTKDKYLTCRCVKDGSF